MTIIEALRSASRTCTIYRKSDGRSLSFLSGDYESERLLYGLSMEDLLADDWFPQVCADDPESAQPPKEDTHPREENPLHAAFAAAMDAFQKAASGKTGLIAEIDRAIENTPGEDPYGRGVRDGLRFAKFMLNGEFPEYEAFKGVRK